MPQSRIAIFEGYRSPFGAQYGSPYEGAFGLRCNKGCVPDPSLPALSRKKGRRKMKLSKSRKAIRARKNLSRCAKQCSKRRKGKFQPCIKKCIRGKR